MSHVNNSNVRATAWSLTVNNPTAADEEYMNLARQAGWKVEGQLEVGAEGTPHYQLLLRTPQVRFAAVKKAFPRAHIEVARNVKALETYVHKDDTREGELPTQQEAYPSLSRFWELVYAQLLTAELIARHPHYQRVDWLPEAGDPLVEFDMAVGNLIDEGYHVEFLAVNPANRSAFKKFSTSLFTRVYRAALKEAETKDETDGNRNGFTRNVPLDGHNPDAISFQEANLPTLPEA